MANVKATIITIGDELLIGQTIDTNSAWIAQRVNDIGMVINRRVAVGDTREAILQALDEERKHVSVLFITGGLGPTADDITKPLLCEYFGGKLIVNQRVLDHVTHIFTRRNLPMLARNEKQAEVPDVCTVLFNERGTAPGMLFKVPHPESADQEQWIVSLPGVPHEMMGIMEDEVLPRLRQHFISDACMHRSIVTADIGESFIVERIIDLEEALPPHIRLAYLPSNRMVKLRLTGVGQDAQQLSAELNIRAEEIANRLEDVLVAMEDLPLEQIIGKKLMPRNQKLAVAESCTGGEIASRLTNVIGSSQYLNGGIIAYQNEIKELMLGVDRALLQKEGAVCEAVALQMARGVRQALNADLGFGITGLLSGGGQEQVPVGTVWMAVADADHATAKKYHFPYDRIRNKDAAVQMGLLLIWKLIEGKV